MMKTDIREHDTGYELDVDLPGFKKDEINVDLENGYLTISAAKDWIRTSRIRKENISAESVMQEQCREASMWAMQ